MAGLSMISFLTCNCLLGDELASANLLALEHFAVGWLSGWLPLDGVVLGLLAAAADPTASKLGAMFVVFSSLGRFGRRPRRLASRDIPTAKHFLSRQNWQLLRLNGVISHCCWFVHWWFMPWVMQRRKKPLQPSHESTP